MPSIRPREPLPCPSWDTGSTFPSSNGYSPNATVFKWQREYFDITGAATTTSDAVTNLTMRPTNGAGRPHRLAGRLPLQYQLPYRFIFVGYYIRQQPLSPIPRHNSLPAPTPSSRRFCRPSIRFIRRWLRFFPGDHRHIRRGFLSF